MSVTAARGFAAAGVHAGIRRDRKDVALMRSLTRATGAAMWTQNRVQAAPVVVAVFPSGLFTKQQRLDQIKQQQPRQPAELKNERWQRVGTAFVERYQARDNAFMTVWTKERGGWRVAAVQGTLMDPDSAATQQAIAAADTRFLDALKRGDVAALISSYTDDAVVLSPNMSAWEGRSAISQGFTGFLSQLSLVDGRVVTKDVILAGDYAIERGTYAWTLHPKTGTGSDIVDNGKYVTVWERQADSSWKIIRDIFNSDRPGTM